MTDDEVVVHMSEVLLVRIQNGTLGTGSCDVPGFWVWDSWDS